LSGYAILSLCSVASPLIGLIAMLEKEKKKRAPRGGAPEPGAKRRDAIRDRDDRAQIEFELASGKSVRAIARKYDIDENALYRHRKNLPPQLKAAYLGNALKPGADLEQLKTEESEALLQNLASQRARLLMMQDRALEASNAQAVATLANSIHKNLELVGRYLGELHQHSTKTVVNVRLTPQYLELRNALVKALAPFPEARQAVAAVLHAREGSAAQSIAPALPSPDMIR
jgi:transposase-like protein